MPSWVTGAAVALVFFTSVAAAQDRRTEVAASFTFNGATVTINRDAAPVPDIAARFLATHGACDGPCIDPMTAAPGVETFGEVEVLAFLSGKVENNTGLMVDARLPLNRAKGYIPGTVSLPHDTVAPDSPMRGDILKALGAREFDGVYNFADAPDLLVYDNGPMDAVDGLLIENLLAAGFPAAKLTTYRGGMLVWSTLGLAVQEGQS